MKQKLVGYFAIVAIVALVFTVAVMTQSAEAKKRVSQTNTQITVAPNGNIQNVNHQDHGKNIVSNTEGIQGSCPVSICG